MPDGDWWKLLWPNPEGVLRRLGIDFGVTVLDLCCGDGHFTTPLAHIVGGMGRVMALDLDAEMIELAKRRAQRAGVNPGAIRWLESDACKLQGVLPAQPEYVLMANTFHGVPDKPQLSREVFNVLKPGGQFAIVNWHFRPREDTTVMGEPRGPETRMRMTPEQVMDEVLPAGFRLHGVIELPPYHYGIVFDKPKAS
ncbi:MAG: class I SAM-dependent methyltransferase [Alphaproteobacteria bacterium]|nr:class I SAM-dependent methyltransferase [Alphaproteobacteria bacterium]MBF0249745.1 class I SAM-dependent methyltransferase [Alphaproteobacteria bacterium]